jgi:hypothetical protein
MDKVGRRVERDSFWVRCGEVGIVEFAGIWIESKTLDQKR